MSKRYSILVREHGADTEVVLCEVDRNPEEVVKVLHQKNWLGRRFLPVYSTVRIRDNDEAPAS